LIHDLRIDAKRRGLTADELVTALLTNIAAD
jgi:hypothetical protein